MSAPGPDMTRAGGIDMPGEIAGPVAIDEVVVHGWDVAVATGGDYSCDEELLQAAYGFAQAAVARDPAVPRACSARRYRWLDDAPLLHRLLGLTGRDPAWQPPGSTNTGVTDQAAERLIVLFA